MTTQTTTDLSNYLFARNNAENVAQVLYLILRERYNYTENDAAQYVYCVLAYYRGRRKVVQRRQDKSPRASVWPDYNMLAVSNFIKGTRDLPEKLRAVLYVHALAHTGNKELTLAAAKMLHIEMGSQVMQGIQRIFKEKRGTLSKLNNAHLMPTDKRGHIKRQHAQGV